MISAILYGRNDSHGYNLHKRAAISLNCIAELLTDPDDELLFVDYNTPNDLPTFIEAIYDTLNPKAKSLLRVLRVRPELHARMVTGTHLSALEPQSRNIAIRRSNPRNRWILFTNTDMIFLPRSGVRDLPDAVAALPDGQYILPRFELPEALWESFPRTDPTAIMRACEELGPRLHLHEVVVSHPYMRFDSPGDFQLVPRQALFQICGFDERMVHGWHSDSNLCKRLYLYYGHRTESLAHRLKGYHCDHTRVATLAHRVDIKLENDLQEFVYGVTEPVAGHQAATWGVPDERIEEIDFANGPQARFATAVERALSAPQAAEYYSDANDLRNFVCYQPEHALPYLAGNLTGYPRNARFVYVGNHPRMLELLARCVAEMGFEQPLHYVSSLRTLTTGGSSVAESPQQTTAHYAALAATASATPQSHQVTASLEEAGSGGSVAGNQPMAGNLGATMLVESPGVSKPDSLPSFLLENYDLLIFDFGLDRRGLKLDKVSRVTEWPKDLRFSLGATSRCLENCAEISEERWQSHFSVPDFIVLNANHHVFKQFVTQFLIATETPFNTHVRKGRPRVGQERLYRSHAWKYTEECLRSFFGYDEADISIPSVTCGQSIDLTSCSRSSRYKEGHWGWMDFGGTWTDGSQAILVFRPPATAGDDLIIFVRLSEAFLGVNGEPVIVGVYVEGEMITRWMILSRFGLPTYKAVIPARLIADKSVCRLLFHIENPQSAQLAATLKGQQVIGEDPRELGIKIQRVTFAGTDRLRYVLHSNIDFTDKGQGVYHINECWTQPDDLGSWTIGPHASLVLLLSEPVDTPVVGVFTVTDVAVSDEYQHLNVAVSFNGRKLADWILGPSRLHDVRKVLVPADVLRTSSTLNISFQIDQPRTPVQLKWSDSDTRPLGFRLTKLRIDPVHTPRYKLGDVIDFTAGGNAFEYVDSQWSAPDHYGSWTVGTEASMVLRFENPPRGAVPASFIISDCMVSEKAPRLPVQVKANGQVVEEWELGPSRVPQIRSIELPENLVEASPELKLAFSIPAPRTPASLGWSSDERFLGIRLSGALFGKGQLRIPVFANPLPDGAHVRNFLSAFLKGLRRTAKGTA